MEMIINDRLKALRQARKYTLEYVAEYVGTSRQTIQRYEAGVISNIPYDKIEALAKAYGTTPAYILGWDNLSNEESSLLSGYGKLSEKSRNQMMDFLEILLRAESQDK